LCSELLVNVTAVRHAKCICVWGSFINQAFIWLCSVISQ